MQAPFSSKNLALTMYCRLKFSFRKFFHTHITTVNHYRGSGPEHEIKKISTYKVGLVNVKQSLTVSTCVQKICCQATSSKLYIIYDSIVVADKKKATLMDTWDRTDGTMAEVLVV